MNELISTIENGHVPALTVALCVFSLVTVLVIFFFMPVYLCKVKGCKIKAYIIGCLVWFVFASIIESLLHSIILSTAAGAVIQGNVWLFALYGGFMAALFEEGGRFLAMKFLLKKEMSDKRNAIMYGAGHGGFEAIAILAAAMLSKIVLAVMINTGLISTTFEALKMLPEESAIASLSGMAQLVTLPPYIFIIGLFERFAAIASHIAMSIFVWFAVKNRKPVLFAIAFLMHFFLDAATVVISGFASNTIVLEVLIYVIVAIYVYLSVKLYKSEANNTAIIEEVQ